MSHNTLTQKPRILALIGSRVLYGQERANLLVMESLMGQGSEILAVVEDNPSFRIMPVELEKRGIPYVEAPTIGRRASGHLIDFLIGNPIRYVRFQIQMRAVLRDFRPTHIHVANPFAFLLAESIAKPGIPIIYRIGDIPDTHNVFWRWIWKRIIRRVTHFVAISRFVAYELSKLGVPTQKITVIHNLPPTRTHPPQPSVPPQRRHVLFIGQLTADKGVDRLIEAFRQIAPDYPDAQLTVIGKISDWSGHDWQRALRDRTRSDPLIGNRALFAGEQDDIYSYLASAAFLAVPSVFQEPLSNVVGEAKAAARPAVVFPSGGLQELIQHGEDGFICRDTSVGALAEGLRYYLSDPERARKHGHNALESMNRLGVAHFAQRWHAVYEPKIPSAGTFATIGCKIEKAE